MAYFLFKCWHERLYSVNRDGIIPCRARVDINFVPINEENVSLVRELRADIYKEQFRKQLELGDFGYYAYFEGKPVGYGWAKHCGSDDYFFKVGEGSVYLCRFFVHESMRGNGIYPALITALTEKESNTERFYIAVERGNASSERGLQKVGFEFVKEFGFIRGFKHTFNKHNLK